MDAFNTTHPPSPPHPSNHSIVNKFATFGLASLLASAGGGSGGLVSFALLLSSIVPVLLSYSSMLRGWVFAPGVWILDSFFSTAYIEFDSSITSEWVGPYLKSLPRGFKGNQLEVESVPYHEMDEDDASRLMWSNSFPHRSLPFATQLSFFLHGRNLVVVSREKRKDYAIGRIKRWTRRSNRSRSSRRGGEGGENDDEPDEEQTKTEFIKIRVLPIPFFSFARRLLGLSLSPTPFLNTISDPIESFIQSAKDSCTSKMDRGPAVFTWQDHHWQTSSGSRRRKEIGSVILPDGQANKILEDVKKFLGKRTYYKERGVSHRRGYLLYGEPGSGKTSLVKAISSELSLSIFYLSLSQKGMDDAELMLALSRTPPFCIVLMEDIDCAFNDNTATRKKDESIGDDALKGLVKALASTKDKEKLTLSGLLNALDGVNSVEGKVIVATTNYIERLDPALIRPGRIDQRLYFGLTTQDQLRGLFEQTHLPTKGELERELTEASSATEDDEKLPARKSKEEIVELAIKFSEVVPSKTFSAASIQGFLFSYQDDPTGALEAAGDWIVQQKKIDADSKKLEEEEFQKMLKLKLKEEKKLMKAALVKEAEEKKKKSEVAKESDESEDEHEGQDLPLPTPLKTEAATSPNA